MRCISLVVVGLFTLTAGNAADPIYIYTRPELPKRETLAKLGLKLEWTFALPVDGKRDGIAVIQFVDGMRTEAVNIPPEGVTEPGDSQLIVQTRSGRVTAIDAETGKEQWFARLGKEYRSEVQQVAANMRTVFVIADGVMYAMDRVDGMIEWTYQVPGALSAAPAADATRLVLFSVGNRGHSYMLPPSSREIRRDGPKKEEEPGKPPEKKPEAYPGRGEGKPSLNVKLKPTPLFSGKVDAGVFQPPVTLPEHAIFVDGEGTVIAFSRDRRLISDRYETHAPIVAPIARHGNNIYVCSKDFNVYAFKVAGGKLSLNWRVTTGSAIYQRASVLGDDIVVVAEDHGIFCIDRETGKVRWPSEEQRKKLPPIREVVGGSKRLIYAVDKQGRLVVLDRGQGGVIGTLDTRDWAVIVPNDVTDRLYLANHDGQIICLRDADKSCDKPLYHNFIPVPPKPKDGEPTPEEPKKDK